ncbi:MAG: hypothetical protein ACJ8EQ_06080 [Sphingomicrobium sp.]
MPLAALLIALAAAPPGAAPQAPPAASLICRSSEREVGSRIRRGRQCKSAQEWELDDARRDRRPADLRVTEGQPVVTGAAQSPH